MREEFERLPEIRDSLSEHIVFIGNKYTTPNPDFYDLVNWLNGAWYAWQAAKAKAVPNTQALHDRLLVESIKDHVDSHLAESESAIDYFDKGWFAAMRCVRHNIAMLEAQEQTQ